MEATLRDGVPQTAGWFVVAVRDARWLHNDMRSVCRFSGEGEAHFDELGLNLYWLEPGRPMSMYHHEDRQEDFLILRGRAILIIEDGERQLQAWDFVHCPPRTPHTIVATGEEPALVVAVGARTGKASVRYPAQTAAIRHGAGVAETTASPDEAYARFSVPQRGSAPELF
jgi:uncharacterized cupin superfamily protein